MSHSTEPFSQERLLAALQHLPPADVYWVGFSGGADSTALLHAMASSGEFSPPRLKALHINHGLHQTADAWQEHCRAFCDELGIEFVARRIGIDPRSGRGPEAEARHGRYTVVEEILCEGEMFLTAHHLDDQAETLLLNLVRGSGVDGLAGMPPSRPLGKGVLARPMLEFDMQSLRDYLGKNKLNWIEDPSNQDPSYDRNFVRLKVLPVLEERWPSSSRSLAWSAHLCRTASAALAEYADSILDQRLDHPLVLDIAGMDCVDERIHFVLRQWLRRNSAPALPSSRIRELCTQLSKASPGNKVRVAWNGWSIRFYRNRLWLQAGEPALVSGVTSWTGLKPVQLGEGAGTVKLSPPTELPFEITIRPRGRGDKIQAASGAARRNVKDILREREIPPWLRDSVPMLCDGEKVLALADQVVSPELAEAMSKSGSRLQWEPGNPVLSFAFKIDAGAAVDPGSPLG